MKKRFVAVALCTSILAASAIAGGYGKAVSSKGGYSETQNVPTQGVYQGTTYLSTIVSTTPVTVLTEQQKEDLIFMYQEEKVARDVYKTLGDTWGLRLFYNIQNSEQQHMDAIKLLLEKYSLPVPVVEDTVGVFENEELQSLYDQLIEQGKASLEDALNVGVLVEETDIADLETRMTDVPDDIKAVYETLSKASYSHLNAFSRVLERMSTVNYTTTATVPGM